MIGIAEIAVIAVVGGIVFFGKNTVVDWAKTIAQVKKTYNTELKDDKVKKTKSK